MKTELYIEQLEELRAELEAADQMDPARRDRLLLLVGDLEQEIAGESESGNAMAELDVLIAEFEASHPTIAAVTRKIMETLGNIGV